jgi:hypothetical protein
MTQSRDNLMSYASKCMSSSQVIQIIKQDRDGQEVPVAPGTQV